MTLARKEIRICMGSSCFSRGNRLTLQVIQQYLKDRHLEDEVILKGNHCLGDCNDGPMVQIGSKVYYRISGDKILEILHNELGDLLED